jgi:3-oxoacyl-[acyl-carrier-protein] synthase-1
MSAMPPLPVAAYTAVTCLGAGVDAIAEALKSERGGLTPCDLPGVEFKTWIGRVAGVEDQPVTGRLARYDCRNNRLARMALNTDGFAEAVGECIGEHGAARVGVVLGTSTSGVAEGERAFQARSGSGGRLPDWFDFRHTHDIHALSSFVAEYLGAQGPCLTVSTACSSSAKVFADAAQLIGHGVCDAVVVGGVDSLCLLTLFGFRALELTSPDICRPNDSRRSGMSIGEGAGFVLLRRADATASRLALLEGVGESSDAHHMSAPHPEGVGAYLAMKAALDAAGLEVGQVDYVNLHGTGSHINDVVEAKAIMRLFGPDTPCSSTKGWTGHTLGAAGITEAVISLLALRDAIMPGNLNLRNLDPEIATAVLPENVAGPVRRVLSNSFGFGGNNCSLVFGQPA